MKRIIGALAILLMLSCLAYAGTKITELTDIGTVALTDVMEIVDDPGGTPASRKTTVQGLATAIKTDTDVADCISKEHTQNTDTGTTGASFTVESNASDAGALYIGQDNAGANGDNSAGIKSNSGTLQFKNKAGNWTDMTSVTAHKDSHDPEDGSDALDTAAAAEIAGVQAAAVGSAHSLARSDHAHAINHGITDNHIVTIDSESVADDEFARFTASGLESRSASEVRGDLGLATTDSPVFVTTKLSGLADGKIPYHVDDATGLADGPTKTDVDSAVSLKHTQHTDTGTTQTSFTIDSGGSIVKKAATKTSDAITKTIGSGGDYADFATAIAAVPDFLAHAVTLTIETGTTLSEACYVRNKHGTTSDAQIMITTEKYYPVGTSTVPTADGGGNDTTNSYLRDTSVFTEDDEYNGCWCLVVGGTGTDNGFLLITDTVAATGDIIFDGLATSDPDATSRYVIVGALIDATGEANGLTASNLTVNLSIQGIGIKAATTYNVSAEFCNYLYLLNCALHGSGSSGLRVKNCYYIEERYGGVVGCNTGDSSSHGGHLIIGVNYSYIANLGISLNNQRGVYVNRGGFAHIKDNFGTGNGTYGTYADRGSIAFCEGTECSGSSGDHSNGASDGSLAY